MHGRHSALGSQQKAFTPLRGSILYSWQKSFKVERGQLSARDALIGAPRHSGIQLGESRFIVEQRSSLKTNPVELHLLPEELRHLSLPESASADPVAAEARLLDKVFAQPASERKLPGSRASCSSHNVRREETKPRPRASSMHQCPLTRSCNGKGMTAALTNHGPVSERRKLRRAQWRQSASARALPQDVQLKCKQRRSEGLETSSPYRGSRQQRQQTISGEVFTRQRYASEESRSAMDILLEGQSTRLSREDEVLLVEAMHSGRKLQQQVARLEAAYNREPSPAELERALQLDRRQIKAKLDQGLRAMQTLVHANKKLVFKLARTLGWERNLPFEDCVMAGMEGLVRGLMKFDTSQGTRLCTYLVHWIRDGISAAISACGRIIRTPRHHQYAIVQVKKARTHLYQRLQRQPTNPEIGRSANIAARRLELVLKLERRHQISCEELIRNASSSDAREDDSVLENLVSPSEQSGEEPEKGLIVEDALDRALTGLTPRKAGLMRCMYDFDRNIDPTQQEVGSAMGLTARRVGQIQKQCLQELRDRCGEELQQVMSV